MKLLTVITVNLKGYSRLVVAEGLDPRPIAFTLHNKARPYKANWTCVLVAVGKLRTTLTTAPISSPVIPICMGPLNSNLLASGFQQMLT
jgi:hypothetical protein